MLINAPILTMNSGWITPEGHANEAPQCNDRSFLHDCIAVTIFVTSQWRFNVQSYCILDKVKVKLSMCFNCTTPWRRIREWWYSSTHSLTSALDRGEWPASRPGRFTPREGAPDTHWIGGWVGPRAVLDVVMKRKIPSPAGKRTLEPQSSSP
jgi:hypothetical protein